MFIQLSIDRLIPIESFSSFFFFFFAVFTLSLGIESPHILSRRNFELEEDFRIQFRSYVLLLSSFFGLPICFPLSREKNRRRSSEGENVAGNFIYMNVLL